MTDSTSAERDRGRTRRRFLAGAASAAGAAGVTGTALVGGAGRVAAANEVITPTMIIPAVDQFEGDYTGQFLTVLDRDRNEGDPQEAHSACSDVPWPEGDTAVEWGQLTDRRSDEPIAVRLPVFVDGAREPITEDTLFMISNAEPCDGDYVTVQTTSVRLLALRGDAPGPSVTETETESFGTGFGLAAGAFGAGVAMLARRLSGRE